MGPSGSEKSRPAECLDFGTLYGPVGPVSGNIMINGHKYSAKFFTKFCSYVLQDDHLCPFFTWQETLECTVSYHARSKEVTKVCVNYQFKGLGLDSCKIILCGNQFSKAYLVDQLESLDFHLLGLRQLEKSHQFYSITSQL